MNPSPGRVHSQPASADPLSEAGDCKNCARLRRALAREQRQRRSRSGVRTLAAAPNRATAKRSRSGRLLSPHAAIRAARAHCSNSSAATEGLPPHVRITRMREAAGTYEARLKNYAAALRCFRVLAELEPENEDVLRAQKRLLERGAAMGRAGARAREPKSRAAQNAEPKLPLLRKLAASASRQARRPRRRSRRARTHADAAARTIARRARR